jgi:hypothetical protein
LKGSIIGLTGRAQAGKDSTGTILVGEYGYTRYAFADALKSMAAVLNPIIYFDPNDDGTVRLKQMVREEGMDAAKSHPEVRRFLQVLGTEAVRDHLGEDAWVEALKFQMTKDGNMDRQGVAYGAKVVITDVRFPNEAAWVKRAGGELWHIRRLEKVYGGLGFKPYDNGLGTDHPSEKYVDDLPADKFLVASDLTELRDEAIGALA